MYLQILTDARFERGSLFANKAPWGLLKTGVALAASHFMVIWALKLLDSANLPAGASAPSTTQSLRSGRVKALGGATQWVLRKGDLSSWWEF